MARYRHVDLSPRLLPVDLQAQLVPGSFAHTLHHLVGALDLSGFDAHYRNDATGAPAHAPGMLLKAVLLGYAQGLVSSRAIERACRENVLFIAITGDAKPHFTTIADFVSRSSDAIAAVFAQVLAVLGSEGLIGREMFAIDGVKLPSNASKYRSGTRAEFLARAAKLEATAKQLLARHRRDDAAGDQAPAVEARIQARLQRVTRQAQQLRAWLAEHPDDRPGTRGGVRKSNLTDNESAKLATDKGVIQGYCAVAVVDAKHQVIVAAQAHGSGNEQALLLPVLDACAHERGAHTLVTADAGYHSEQNLAGLAEREIDALVADPGMRLRDERLAGQDKHRAKPSPLHDKRGVRHAGATFGQADFAVAPDRSHVICPAGQRLARNGNPYSVGGYVAQRFAAPASVCGACPLRTQCLRNPRSKRARQFALLDRARKDTHSQRMRTRIDSAHGREQYGRRLATVEPVFANLRHNKRLGRFTLRGRRKVDAQWKLFALVHNIEKLGKQQARA